MGMGMGMGKSASTANTAAIAKTSGMIMRSKWKGAPTKDATTPDHHDGRKRKKAKTKKCAKNCDDAGSLASSNDADESEQYSEKLNLTVIFAGIIAVAIVGLIVWLCWLACCKSAKGSADLGVDGIDRAGDDKFSACSLAWDENDGSPYVCST